MKTVSSHKRIHRDLSRSVISGVCAGVARYFDIDPVWVRFAAVVSLFMIPGVSLLAYIAAVIVLPRSLV